MIRVVLEAEAKVDLKDLIKDEIKEDTEIYEKEILTKDGRVVVLMYEKYYLRINSDLNVTILYEELKEFTRIELIASGGSVGFIGTSYGAEDKALEGITEKLKSVGFSIKE